MKSYYYLLIISAFSWYSCTKKNIPIEELELLNSYAIAVPEPSGLAVNNSGNILFTVSDQTNKIYKLSTTGLLLQSYNFTGDDLEGICTYTDDKLLIAEERTKNIIEFTLDTEAVTFHQSNYENEAINSGIEGVTYNQNTQNIYFLNEKNPDKLFKLNSNFQIIATFDLNFANDYSGIFYDENNNKLWIVSDESQSINKCTLEGERLESYHINVQKPEGIAIANNKIYIVSDSQQRLYIFQKPN